MSSKWYTLFVIALMGIGCALPNSKDSSPSVSENEPSKPSKNPSWTAPYIGLKGYFNRPPVFETPNDQNLFQRCSQFTVKSFQFRNDRLVMTVSQGANSINMVGANRKAFKLNAKSRIYELDHYFLKDLKWSSKNRDVASNSQKACEGKITQSMTEAQVLFAIGEPEKVYTHKRNNRTIKEWIYVGKENSTPISYFFNRGRYYAWKND